MLQKRGGLQKYNHAYMESGVVCPVSVLGLPQFGLGGAASVFSLCSCKSTAQQCLLPLGVADGIPIGKAGVRVSDSGAQGETQMGIVGSDSEDLVVRF